MQLQWRPYAQIGTIEICQGRWENDENWNAFLGSHTRGDYNKSPEEFTGTDWSQGLAPQTVHTKRFEEQVAGTCPKKNSNWFELVGLEFKVKNGQFTRLVAETSRSWD